MIIRILGEGQYAVTERDVDALNELDGQLLDAADHDDDARAAAVLEQMRAVVRTRATPVPATELRGSDLVLPAADTALSDIRALLRDEGLIPG